MMHQVKGPHRFPDVHGSVHPIVTELRDEKARRAPPFTKRQPAKPKEKPTQLAAPPTPDLVWGATADQMHDYISGMLKAVDQGQ